MKNTFKFLLFVFLGALCLMASAFYNGYPIVYSDTSTYIASGLELKAPFDRPITYGLFLRIFSLNGLSLWFVIFFQALILSYLLFLLTKLATNERLFLKFGLLTIILLSLFTGVSWTVSQVMPDIFTSIALLSATLILLGTYKRSTLILLYVLFVISVAMHMSHVLLFVLILLVIFGCRKFVLPIQDYPSRNVRLTMLLLLTVAAVGTMGSAISKSKHVFFMGAMVEHGIAKQYLDQYCQTKPFKLCAYKDAFPQKAYQFVWDDNSPFYKVGGWKETKSEFNEIIYGSLSEPKYIAMHLKASCKATLQQLTLFSIGDGNGSFLEGTLLYERLAKYFSRDLATYTASKQSQSQLNFIQLWNALFTTVIVISLLLIVFLATKFASTLDKHHRTIALLFFIGILLNAWDCGTFANAIDRLGCKMIWLIPCTAIILLLRILNGKALKKA